MITIYDIAKKCGVSPSTVSKVINNYDAIPEETKEKVRTVMAELNYIPNVGAKSLSKGKSRNIGVLAYFGMNISPFKHALFTEILDSFQTEINEANYDLLFISRNVDGQHGSFLKNCLSHDVAGVVLFGNFDHPEMKEVISSPLPKVAFDYIGDSMTNVSSNSKHDMYELTKYLISLGHRNIVFVHGEPSTVTGLRVDGFKNALAECGIPFNDQMLEEGRYFDTDSARNITKKILKREDRPTAIMYPDDYSAIASLQVIAASGLSCPDDISITGYDGLEVSQIVNPHLTTVRQDLNAIGKILAKKLIEAIEKPNTPLSDTALHSNLLIGESTDKPKK